MYDERHQGQVDDELERQATTPAIMSTNVRNVRPSRPTSTRLRRTAIDGRDLGRAGGAAVAGRRAGRRETPAPDTWTSAATSRLGITT